MEERKHFFLQKQMSGGGAERVVSLLATELRKRGYLSTIILTHQSLEDADLSRLNDEIEVISLPDELDIDSVIGNTAFDKMRIFLIKAVAKAERVFLPKGKKHQLVKMYKIRNYAKYKWLKSCFAEHKDSTLIAFLYDSIFLTLLAADKTNKVIISDRGDPGQSISSRTDMAFFELMFKKADHMVFQSPDVCQWYKDRFGLDGKIIFNPIKPDLPLPYQGNRKKRIVNFCRISPEKNLEMLLAAFESFVETHSEYYLHIFGDRSSMAPKYYDIISERIKKSKIANRIQLFPFHKDIHIEVIDYTMFVSSSNHEGMSNSMLEAMAIGLPTICTDCPAGGARAVIKDHENGILTPVSDAMALAKAMEEVADNPELAEKLSKNGSKIRETQNVDKIINQWMELIND